MLAIFADGAEPAVGEAASAADAVVLADEGLAAGGEGVALLDVWLEDEVEVGGVDVAVGEDLVLGQGGEGGDDAGFAGAAFAADDNEFFHDTASVVGEVRCWIRLSSWVNMFA